MSYGTITPPKPDPKYEPGECGRCYYDQMRLPGFPPDPAKEIESDYCKMSKGQKYVEEFEQLVLLN